MASSSLPLFKSLVRGTGAATRNSATKTYDLISASTGKIRAQVEMASPEAIQAAISAAQEAQPRWYRDYSPMERSKVLLKAAQIMTTQAEALAHLETADTGRPIQETRAEGPGAADCLEWFAGLTKCMGGGQHMELAGGNFGYTRREPLGVTVGIGAWNYPLQSAVWKSAPALAFGNAMVFKPSELTPQTALRLADIYEEAGIPEGVFSVVLGDGPTVGTSLVQDPRVSKVSFTGSVPTGRKIYTQAAHDFKKVTLELGGKSPLIIFDDTNLDVAVTAAMVANWYSSGQVCSNGTRVFIHKSMHDAFVERLLERTQQLIIGDPMNDTTDIGPVVSEAHLQKVQDYIRIGVAEDQAQLVYGGQRIQAQGQQPLNPQGFYMQPAIFTDCTDSMRIVQEEIFGMVMSILPFTSEEEVLQRANDTTFGLSAGVFTKDLQRAHRMVAQLQAGTTWINTYNLAPVELPWGGWKHSGMGSENGVAGMESWTRMKSVYVEMNDIQSPFSC